MVPDSAAVARLTELYEIDCTCGSIFTARDWTFRFFHASVVIPFKISILALANAAALAFADRCIRCKRRITLSGSGSGPIPEIYLDLVIGTAFTDIRTLGATLAYFPGISVSKGERSEFNFGSKPFVYPVEGFQPLKDQPTAEQQQFVQFLLDCFKRLARLFCGATSSGEGAMLVCFQQNLVQSIFGFKVNAYARQWPVARQMCTFRPNLQTPSFVPGPYI